MGSMLSKLMAVIKNKEDTIPY